VTVSGVTDLTPLMRRVTFSGGVFPALGNDHYARLLLPRFGPLVLPTTSRWYPELLAMDPAVRPWLRNYTLRAVRPEAGEVDVDFVLHAGGPAAAWAAGARVGDEAGLIEQGAPFTPSGAPLLVVADETGLPAALSIASGSAAMVVLEVAGESEQIPGVPGALWVHRSSGLTALAVLRDLDLRIGQAWVAGEAGLATGVRRHLVRDRGWPKGAVTFAGYYRRGRAQYPRE
jgi:NADPH-dependent ferric siderophore reductase